MYKWKDYSHFRLDFKIKVLFSIVIVLFGLKQTLKLGIVLFLAIQMGPNLLNPDWLHKFG